MCGGWSQGTGGRGLDEVDRALVRLLQQDARMPVAELARRVGRSRSSTHDRVKRLETQGVIEAYSARVDAQAVGVEVLAFAVVRLNGHARADRVEAVLAEADRVLEVHSIVGGGDLLVKVCAGSSVGLKRFLREEIQALPAVERVQAHFVLETVKDAGAVPLLDAGTG